MAILTKERFFGEGISLNGEDNPVDAFSLQLSNIREKRLKDLIGDKSFSAFNIVDKFEEIAEAINRADKQAHDDNIDHINKYAINFKIKKWN